MSSPIVLPIATVQPTLTAVIDDIQSGIVPYEDIWISCYKKGSPSKHGKVTATLDEEDRNRVNFETKEENVSLKSHGVHPNSTYTAACPSLNIPETKVYLPSQEYADPDRSNVQRPHRITAFDISPDGSQYAAGYLDGSVHLYPVTTSFMKRKQVSLAHKSTVNSLQFFPSSRVLLSAGADFTLHILPAEPLDADSNSPKVFNSVRSLMGHTRAITATAIVALGRNIISASRDSTVRLWDVAASKEISCIRGESSYSAIALARRSESNFDFPKPDGEGNVSTASNADSREVETDDKLVYCASQNGVLDVLDLRTKGVAHRQTLGSGSFSCLAYSSSTSLLATGTTKGVITIHDVRALETPMTTFCRNDALVESLSFLHNEGEQVNLVVGTEDGMAFVANIRPEGPSVEAEIVGGDCDAVHVVKGGSKNEFWTASGDGIVRKYQAW